MRILFTHSYFLRFDEKQWRTMQPYAPLATIGAAAVLRKHGFEVALHDVTFTQHPGELSPLLESFRPDLLVIYDDGFNYLTKMCLTNMRDAAFEMCRLAQAKGIGVAVSSSDSSDHPGKYLDCGADFVLTGEAEKSLLELCEALRDNTLDASEIRGLVFRAGEKMVRTPGRPVMNDLDALPLPAWDLVDVAAYRDAWIGSSGYFSINMSTTRGCPFKCNWCAKPIYGNRYNARSPEHVFAELQHLHSTYGFDHIWFCDDIFGLKPGWVARFASLLRDSGIRIRFKIQSRADLLLHDDQIRPLAEAGCETVWMGAESGSQKILDAMDKGITVEQIEMAARQLQVAGIRRAFFLQFGYPGETMDDIHLTLGMLKQLMPDEIGISVSYPLPGTKFYEKVRAELVEKANWTDSDELAMLFRGTYPPEFYKQLHRYVHAYYRRLRNERQARRFNLRAIFKMPLYAFEERRRQKCLHP